MEFDHPLRRYRVNRGLTLEQIADKVGVSFVTISRIEGRKQQASHRLLIRLSEATGIPIEDLVRASSVEAA